MKGRFSKFFAVTMIFDFGWENMEGENDKSSIHAVERWKKKMFTHVAHNSGIGWSAIFLENHDQSRCLNKFLERENISFYSASALASIYFFLYGTPFIYQGQEIGMTNVKWKNINDMDDIRAKRTYEEAVGQGKDPDEVLAYFSELGRDNARTPMQWDDSENGGFTCGKPWIKCNDNYRTINAQSEVNDPDSLYNYYKRLIQCYHDHADIVRQAEFRPMYEEYPGLFAYEREILGTDFSFDIEIRYGAGAFVCGEETALIHSMEGKRGEPTLKPPFPAESGYLGKPTNVNNVETLANIPIILTKGADWFATIGTERSKGTKVFALAGKINNVGLIEVPMGTTLREVIYEIGRY